MFSDQLNQNYQYTTKGEWENVFFFYCLGEITRLFILYNMLFVFH